MKNNYHDDYVILSAYLDNELTDEEREYIENRLKNSVELRNKLEELKKSKELAQSLRKDLQENPYFEQKVMSALLEEKTKSFYEFKWVPVFGIISFLILTTLFFFNLKPESFKELFDKKSEKTLEYTSNLKPLFLPSEITNEDLFNFALYEEIPLKNEDNQILKIGLDNSGKEYFEVKKINTFYQNNNLQSFLSKLNLSDIQKLKIDSLFEDYANQLSKHILIGDDNAIAINSSVWNLRKALLADFISLTRQLDSKNFDRLASNYNIPVPKSNFAWNKAINSNQANKYIVFTQDSVFTSEIEPNEFADLNNRTSKIDIDSIFIKQEGKVKIIKSPGFVQIQVEEIEIPDIQIPDFNSFIEFVERSIQNRSKVNIINNNKISNDKSVNQDKGVIYNRYNDINLDSILELQNKRLENPSRKTSSIERNKKDNLPQASEKLNDNNSNEELKAQIEKLREEIRKFREQFHNYIKEDSLKSKVEQKPVIDDQIEI
ncbi:MAG: hypothetical protein NZM09_06495 [Ignavibacterium sp.]|nr:hypothetical protein [Ignavibacterium sp.]MDW8375330.1 hypothetical protein [Ignavibacteriales bacterium]